MLAVGGPWAGDAALAGVAAVSRATSPGDGRRLRLILNVPYLLLVARLHRIRRVRIDPVGWHRQRAGWRRAGRRGWVSPAHCWRRNRCSPAQPRTRTATTGGCAAPGSSATHRCSGASLTAGFNLCWRVRYALPDTRQLGGFRHPNTAVILTAVVYGVVALTAVLVASRWILRNTPAIPVRDPVARLLDAGCRNAGVDPSRRPRDRRVPRHRAEHVDGGGRLRGLSGVGGGRGAVRAADVVQLAPRPAATARSGVARSEKLCC